MFERPDRVVKGRFDHQAEAQEVAQLYVVTTVFNPIRYRTRWKLYQDFAAMVERSGAILYTVEVAFGNRQFAVTEPGNPQHLQLVTTSEIWHKEAALNLLIQRLPIDWQYVAVIDADVSFIRGDWANETLHQLQHYDIVQMWGEADDLDAQHHTVLQHSGFVADWLKYHMIPAEGGYYGKVKGNKVEFHPGFAWGYRKRALDDLGGLIDYAILGAADNHMAKSLVGNGRQSVHPAIQGPYLGMILHWQDRAQRYIKRNIGVVDGKLLHYWHGAKANRKYWDRWKILTSTQFNPRDDLKRDTQGMYQLVVENGRQQQLRNLLRDYFRGRDEDGTS